ncbi:hypothetical protein AY606_15425 [Acinetobacter sp. SFB]|uniref:OmpW/AlkL family protein n=1 Tax=Acinetobacter sp. SFB TaxID=1805634 RepID=UPI0007D83B77|nr:OmpW family outer membrane protein [Acinetobacter sp. SFB]OAL80408.1 hypothetical protein AY606_15425 [Acinetobacter sp. SFB]
MNNRQLLKKLALGTSLIFIANLSSAEGLKRFSVSAGWLHVMPQGKANAFSTSTAVKNGHISTVGTISEEAFINSVDPAFISNDPGTGAPFFAKDVLTELHDTGLLSSFVGDGLGNINATESGTAQIQGLEHWSSAGTGLEADDVDTLGLTFNYYINDNISLQIIGGIPPEVDIKGKGEIYAPLSGHATPTPGSTSDMLFPEGLDLRQDIPITNLGNKAVVSTVRAWTPAIEAQYQFGKSGVNRFRPYVGAGIMYAYFNKIELNSIVESDLIAAGHMIQNVLDNKAGAALDGKISSADPSIKVKTTDAIAPIVTLGATYDLTANWYGVASVSYAKLNNRVNIDVIDNNSGNRLIHSSTKIDIDPLITYMGIGYRF